MPASQEAAPPCRPQNPDWEKGEGHSCESEVDDLAIVRVEAVYDPGPAGERTEDDADVDGRRQTHGHHALSLSAREQVIGDTTYVYYEYISQGSPNLQEREATTFRHSLGVTAIRGDYLYTCTFSSPESFWDINADGFESAIRSFRLTPPNRKKYREPGNEGLLPPLPF